MAMNLTLVSTIHSLSNSREMSKALTRISQATYFTYLLSVLSREMAKSRSVHMIPLERRGQIKTTSYCAWTYKTHKHSAVHECASTYSLNKYTLHLKNMM